jgi:cephalosporin-C deacetylase
MVTVMKVRTILCAATLLFAALACASPCAAQQLVVSPDKPSGVYAAGDTVRWTIAWRRDAAPPAARYVMKSGGLKEVVRGDVTFAGNVATLESKFDAPGTMLVEVEWEPKTPGNRASGGAVADPEKITPAAAEPADFDAFWKAKLDELAKVPPNAKLRPADGGKAGVEYAKITLDNIRGTHVNGQIARPAKGGGAGAGAGEKFPALLIVQWAGVYPLQKAWVADRAADGWLALNILPHDLPIDEPESFYKEQFAGPLKNYWAIGNDDRETSYYLRMYLSCVRALEYLKGRPDWDGRTLVVVGTSQGGQQALVTAGLQPAGVTAVLPFLPAACDMLAPDVGRASGFPNWYTQVHGKDAKRVRDASRYYDPVNFARRIKCPVLIGLALKDDLAPPGSVLAAANVINAPKEVIILPTAGHQDEKGSQKAYNDRCYGAWLPALRQGQPPPFAARTSEAGGGDGG